MKNWLNTMEGKRVFEEIKTRLEKTSISSSTYSIEDINAANKTFRLEFRYHDVSFDDLSQISEAFDTKKINLGSEERSEGYCETCSYSYTVCIVRVEGADIF